MNELYRRPAVRQAVQFFLHIFFFVVYPYLRHPWKSQRRYSSSVLSAKCGARHLSPLRRSVGRLLSVPSSAVLGRRCSFISAVPNSLNFRMNIQIKMQIYFCFFVLEGSRKSECRLCGSAWTDRKWRPWILLSLNPSLYVSPSA